MSASKAPVMTVAELSAVVAQLAQGQAQLLELLQRSTAPQVAPQAAPKATPKAKAEKPADPKAEWKKRKTAIKKARKAAQQGTQEYIDLTCDYRDAYVEGFNAGYWPLIQTVKLPDGTENTLDFTSFWESTVNGAWAKLVRGTTPVAIAPAKRAPKAKASDPTGNTASANVDKSAHMQRVQASRGYCPPCRGAILLGHSPDVEDCNGTYTNTRGLQTCKLAHEFRPIQEEQEIARPNVLDTADAESAADREAARITAFMQTLTPQARAAFERSMMAESTF